MQDTILPKECIGIIGGGQLGQMLTIAAKRMGYKVAILEPDEDCPASNFANYHIKSQYDDLNGLVKLASLASVVTTEFENVPSSSMEYLEKLLPVNPSSSAILTLQNRLNEKKFFNQNGINTTKHCSILMTKDIDSISQEIFPAILKINSLGYDGKGQAKVRNKQEVLEQFNRFEQMPCILEKTVDLKLEVSIVIARNKREIITYPIVENIHHEGILHMTIAPARIDENIKSQITKYSIDIIEKLRYIGVLAIEFFITKDNQILGNEMAPRPHNSAHYTIDACTTSQFEQQIRSICNLKLGEVTLTNNAIMLNLLGNIWLDSDIMNKLEIILTQYSNLKLHLYGKSIPKKNRKMGHLTIIGNDMNKLLLQMNQIKLDLGINF